MIEEVIKNIGLTEYETKVYMALLDLGKATSGEILSKAEINTGKIYDILNSLKKKGFIGEVVESGVKKFSPADPSNIRDYLDERKKLLEKQEKDLDNILPTILNKINSQKEDVKIEVFFGLKGIKTAHKKETERYNKNETVNIMGVMGPGEYAKKVYDFFVYNIYPQRIKTGVTVRKILDEGARKFRFEHEKKAKIKYFPYVSPVALVTIGNLTIIDISTENPISITIESKEVAKSFIQQFNLLWKIAKP